MSGQGDNKDILIIECGVAQTRAALIKDDDVAKIWFGPASGDEHLDQTPQSGRQYCGRVTSMNTSLNAAFVDLGACGSGYLTLTKKVESKLSEGAKIRVEVKSPPRQGKNSVVKFVDDSDLQGTDLGRCPPFDCPMFEAVKFIGASAGKILVDDGVAATRLRAHDIDAKIDHYTDAISLFEAFGVESVIDIAVGREVDLVGGGRLIIDEAQAVTAIDVDTAGLSASSSERLREKIAIAAARESARQIMLRNIGGHVIIDFPKLKSETSRKRFTDFLFLAMKQVDGARALGFSKSGLFSMTVPHQFQSLNERFSQADHQVPTPGRRFTTQWLAQTAIRQLEHRLRVVPSGTVQLQVGEALFNYIQNMDEWLKRLEQRQGGRFKLILDEKRVESDFEISEQR